MPSRKSRSKQVAARLTPIEVQRIEELAAGGLYRSGADFAREAIREKLRTIEPAGIMTEVPSRTAERMITDFLGDRPGSHFASKIADDLGLA